MANSRTEGEGAGESSAARTPSSDVGTLASGGVGRGEEATTVLGIGSVLGRYVVLERLGAGAMGVVYAAFDPDLDRKIALKLLPSHHRDGNRVRREERLIREAKAIAKLSHPNIVGIFDVGVHHDQVFLAMEFLGGGTLKRWITAEKRSWREVLKIFIEAGRGLAGAHTENLIHRDFKPENVLLDKNGVAKVVDFGLVALSDTSRSPALARVETIGIDAIEASGVGLDLSPATLTRTGALMGTPAYMAPEQFLGKSVDARTDQFAFCASLYEALYGERPFPGETVAELAKSVTSGELRPAPASSPVPGWIRKVVVRGLATDPDQRYPSLPDLLQTLSRDPIAIRRRRIGAAAVLLVVSAGAIGLQQRVERNRAEFEQRIAARLAEGNKAFTEAQALKQRVSSLRNQALAAFDSHDREGGERTWADARAVAESFDGALDRAQRALDATLAMDQARAETRHRLAEVVYERALLAELEVRREDLARHLATLDAVDTAGELRQRWRQPGSISVRTTPPDARIAIERYESDSKSRLTAVGVESTLAASGASQTLAPGSYRLRVEKNGFANTFYPFVLRRGESLSVDVPLARQEKVPPGYQYVPAGRFLYGDPDDEWRLSFLNAVPLHERRLPAFLINAHETTFGEWIEFLTSLPSQERTIRLPASKVVQGSVALTQPRDGQWKLRLDISSHPIEAMAGTKLVYPGRPAEKAAQDWLKMPVIGISARDMRAYLTWLSTTGKVPGARLCTDAEWERAARGADDRVYPSAPQRLPVGTANVDTTYGRISGAYGPDEVGRHPESRSPFGLDDMAGNVWEVVGNEDVPGAFMLRGGCYYGRFQDARSTNREPIELETRSYIVGFRVCADWPGTTN